MLFVGSQAFAQVVDMRAFSRQRGYRAYRVEQVSMPMPVRSYPVHKQAESPSSENRSREFPVSGTPVRENNASEDQAFDTPVSETVSAENSCDA